MLASHTSPSSTGVEWRYFWVGVVFLAFGIILTFWAFFLGKLTPDQRMILLWALPVVSGFVCGSFTGSLTVRSKGLFPGVIATAMGGFGVWLLTYLMLPKSDPDQKDASLNEYKKYVVDTHGYNAHAIDQAIKRGPNNADVLTPMKTELEQVKDEIINNVDHFPGLPARFSTQKYNKILKDLKSADPGFKPTDMAVDPRILEEQQKKNRDGSAWRGGARPASPRMDAGEPRVGLGAFFKRLNVVNSAA